MSNEEWFAANRAMWDERVPIHLASSFYNVDAFRAGASGLQPFEAEDVGDVEGVDLVHLQCHFGMDTLTWARRGARVTGLDFSAAAIEAAQQLAAEVGLEAEFVAANVYDAVAALGGRQFDIVYTGIGALPWLPDIRGWAEVVAALVRPGGFLYLTEHHPLSSVFADDAPVAVHDYFHHGPLIFDEPGTYAEPDAQTVHNRSFEAAHPLGDVVTALISAGLRIDFLHEHESMGWKRWPYMVERTPGIYTMPPGMPSLPLVYALKATKPG